jgi:YegS/Rv2252/BmrU family lipid kinase
MLSPGKNRALFILNPYAGIPPVNFIISKELDRRKNELAFCKSLSIDDSGILIKQNLDKHDVFVAAGGDGTVHTVATELIDSEKILGVLPIGSGNGFAREFRFRRKIRSLLRDINNGESLNIDIIEINEHLCLNVAGVGLDSIVAHSFDKLKTRGFWGYVWVTLKSFFKLHPIHVVLKSSGEIIASEDLFVLTIANTRQFGHNAFIAPDAVPNDGKMDIVLIKPFPKYLSPVFIYRLFTKNLKDSKYVRHIKTEKEVIIQTDETRFHVDGEALVMSGDVVVKIKREALRVLKTAKNKRFWSTGS